MPDSPTPNVFGYNAKATDYSTGLQYLRARYYDTTVQRFVQEDDYRGKFTNPASMNRYAYVGNNPTMRVDPSGYFYYMGNQQVSTVKKPQTATSKARKVSNPNTGDSRTELTVSEYIKKQNEAITTQQGFDENIFNVNIVNNHIITPDKLTYGEAVYTSEGYYCRDLTEIQEYKDNSQKYANYGVPSDAAHFMAAHDMDAEFMSFREVNNRNVAVSKGVDYMNNIFYVESASKNEYYDGKYNDYLPGGLFYAGTPYMQLNFMEPDEVREASINGSLVKDGKILGSADCSSLLSYAWNLELRRTTLMLGDMMRYSPDGKYGEEVYGISGDITQVTDYKSLAPGDAILVDEKHVRLVLENDGENIVYVDQSIDLDKSVDNKTSYGITNIEYYEYEDLAGEGYVRITISTLESSYWD